METGYKFLRRKRRKRKRTQTRTHLKPGRREGSINTRTKLKELRAKQELIGTGKPFATDLMDTEIERLGELMTMLYPWDSEGKQLKGKSVQAYYWASELRRDYLALRAPFQSPRLSAMQIVPAQSRQQTVVAVTILNERGEQVYSDSENPPGDAKLIEHAPMVPAKDEEAA